MSKQTTTNNHLHHGHRDRMKKRFIETGGRDFSDHELLEMLLFYVIPRSDTNELAHSLLNEFGTLRDVLNADSARVERVMGAGKSTAVFLSLLFTIRKRIDIQKYENTRFVADSAIKVGNYFIDYFKDMQHEEFCVMLLDNSLKLIEFKSLSKGSVNSASVDVRALTRYALVSNASHVILAHNHPSGLTIPSVQDRQITTEVEAALSTVGISLMEHMIVNNTSFRPTMYMRVLGTGSPEYAKMYKRFYENL